MVKSGKASCAAAAADGLEKECFWNGLRHSLLHLIVSISASIPVSAQCELAVGEGGCPFEKQQKQNLVPSFIQNGCYLYFSFQSKSPGWVHPASDRRYLSLCGKLSLSVGYICPAALTALLQSFPQSLFVKTVEAHSVKGWHKEQMHPIAQLAIVTHGQTTIKCWVKTR